MAVSAAVAAYRDVRDQPPFFANRGVELAHGVLARVSNRRRYQFPDLVGAVLVEPAFIQIDGAFFPEYHVPLAVRQSFERARMQIELAVIEVHVVLEDVFL